MIYVGNLVDAIIAVMEHPQASGQVFMVSDGHDLSVAQFVAMMADTMGRKPRLFPFPINWLHRFFRIMGRGAAIEKISRPLTVDASKIRNTLGWRPPFPVHVGINDTVVWFYASAGQNTAAS
jgi:nucleoside-diphosphate-sugar epimerase